MLGPAQKTTVGLGTRKRKALSDIGNDNNGDYPDGDSALLDKLSPAVSKRKKTQRVITKDAPQAIEMTKKGRKKKVCVNHGGGLQKFFGSSPHPFAPRNAKPPGSKNIPDQDRHAGDSMIYGSGTGITQRLLRADPPAGSGPHSAATSGRSSLATSVVSYHDQKSSSEIDDGFTTVEASKAVMTALNAAPPACKVHFAKAQ